jgi:RluA family pseudouridine synthase
MTFNQEGERICTVRVGPDQAGRSLLDLVAERFTYQDREQWRRELAAGRLLHNGKPAPANRQLAAGDEICYRWPGEAEPPVALAYQVVYEDADLLVVDKPAPLPCHPGGRYFRHTLWARLRQSAGLDRPCLVNRLDRETSGLVLVAKNQATARLCARQWQERRVTKVYLVLVEGDFPWVDLEARGSLAPDPASMIRKKVRFFPASCAAPAGARSCSTRLRRLAGANGLTLVEARPVTGRCHQIRATLSGLGFPVVGDKLYGVDERLFLRFIEDRLSAEDWRRLRLPRQALHGAELSLRHPVDSRPLHFVSPLPPELSKLLA